MEKEFDFCAEWANHLLKGLENEDSGVCPLKNCAEFHYQVNQMDETIAPYIGNLKGFISFLEGALGWIVTYCKEEETIVVDENKDYCVCPVAGKTKGKVSTLLCDCSACYAEKMFSKVCQREVCVVVRRSVLRDGKSCIYEIKL